MEPDRLAAIAGRLRGKAAGRSLPFFIQRFFEELCNQRNGAVADEIVSADYVSHGPQASPAEGPDGVRVRIAVYQNAPEGHWDVQEILSAGEDRVVVRWIGRGTHTGELMGARATGASIACDATTIFRIADGKIAEEWTVWDALGLLQQGGAVPCPPEPIWVLDRRSAIEHLRTSWHSRREAQAAPARSPASLWSAQARKEPGERPAPRTKKVRVRPARPLGVEGRSGVCRQTSYRDPAAQTGAGAGPHDRSGPWVLRRRHGRTNPARENRFMSGAGSSAWLVLPSAITAPIRRAI